MPILFTNVRTLPSPDISSSGLPFSYQQPYPGFALIGIALRAGHWIDQVSPIFAEMLEDGSIGPEVQGPSFGGPGGTPQELRVAPGHVVTGIHTRSGNFVDAVRLMHARWDGGMLDTSDQRWTQWAGSANQGGVERMERLVEPHGAAVAVGVAGRAGGYIDNLTLISAELVRVTGTAVAKATNRGATRANIATG
jgi:hypothetical protein